MENCIHKPNMFDKWDVIALLVDCVSAFQLVYIAPLANEPL